MVNPDTGQKPESAVPGQYRAPETSGTTYPDCPYHQAESASLPGKPTTQGKNERWHQTLMRFLDANQPATLEQLRKRVTHFRDHYNNRRHRALKQATPRAAWELLEHTPATEPIPLAILEGKAAQYRQVRRLRQSDLGRSSLTIGKDGQLLPEPATTAAQEQQGAAQSLVEVTAANRQVYYQGYHVSLPTTFAGRQCV